MKSTIATIVILVLIIGGAIFLYDAIFIKESVTVETDYKPGQPDTVWYPYQVSSPADTVYRFIGKEVPVIPSDSSKIDTNEQKRYSTTFDIKLDSNTRVLGEVAFQEPIFEFLSLEVIANTPSILQVDTLTKVVVKTIVKPRPFYEDLWFWLSAVLTTYIFVKG